MSADEMLLAENTRDLRHKHELQAQLLVRERERREDLEVTQRELGEQDGDPSLWRLVVIHRAAAERHGTARALAERALREIESGAPPEKALSKWRKALKEMEENDD